MDRRPLAAALMFGLILPAAGAPGVDGRRLETDNRELRRQPYC